VSNSFPIKSPRKLIEVALPLDAINAAAAREKSIRHGHPSTLHLWWARRPLAAARAVIFAQLVNDPGYQQGGGFKYGMNKKDAAEERKRLFKIIEDLVIWENTTNEVVLERARAEIRRSWREVCELNKDHPQATELFNPEKLPALHDPFAGGGAIPLEAQRLGLEAYASDLNPVPVIINKAMIEIPPKFAGRSPVRPGDKSQLSTINLQRTWPAASGLAEDVRYYGAWMRAEAEKRIGHLYPPVEITAEMARERPDLKPLVGQKLVVIAWLWARTVKSPNPAFSHVDVPLASTFVLSSKEGKEAYVKPVVEGDRYRFTVKVGTPPPEADAGTKLARANFGCIFSGAPIETKYVRVEAQAGRMGTRLMAVVAEGSRGRVYLTPSDEMQALARSAKPAWRPDLKVTTPCHDIDRLPMYGMYTWADAFTPRQLVALTTFSDLVGEARERVRQDAIAAGYSKDPSGIETGGLGAHAYSEAVSVYLACAVSKVANIGSSIASWMNDRGAFRETFARQAIPMTWDFAEANTFADAGGSFDTAIDKGAMAIETLPANTPAFVFQSNASTQEISINRVVSTDPPYYDNIGYADLSDFFYVWLRPALRSVYPELLATISVPKAEELVATPYRHGGKAQAERFFLAGMTGAMSRLANQATPTSPITIYYAFKQSDTDSESATSSTGWETFLEAVHRAGLQLTGTWPMRTEGAGRLVAKGTNALASSVILVCRKRSVDASMISRREFIRELNIVLPDALDEMTKGAGGEYSPVAPVDLSQAIIGPGMAVFSKYAAVLEANGDPMTVRTALQLINRFLAEDDFDADTQWCLRWFEQYGWAEGVFGEADVLARSKSISVSGLAEAGVVLSGGGKVSLRKWADYPTDWDPSTDIRQPIWETLHHLIRALKQEGESSAGKLLGAVKSKSEATRQLAYRLYTLCERQGWSEDARAYNELITSWTGIESAAGAAPEGQTELFS
jgi:putative DNA methylase